MASAELKEQRVVTREVVLTLTEEEAQFVHFLLGCVAGEPLRSSRRHARSVMEALEPLLQPLSGWTRDLRRACAGELYVYFKDDADVAA